MPKAKKKTKGAIEASSDDIAGPSIAPAAPSIALGAPSAAPSVDPSAAPSVDPSAAPSVAPSVAPPVQDPVILSDIDAFLSIRQGSRAKYIKAWMEFKNFFPNANLDDRRPSEQELRDYFINMRTVRGCASTTIWTNFSMINSICKSKYSFDIKTHPRIMTMIKSFEGAPKKKAAIFTAEELRAFCEAPELDGAYWIVRKAVVVLAYFGGLRLVEAMNLVIEKIQDKKDGSIQVKHCRSKQRTDKENSKFDVPTIKDPEAKGEDGFDWANCLRTYINMVKEELGMYSGRVFYTGKKDGHLTRQVMGRNMLCEIPHQVAEFLGKENIQDYTFHSFRRSSATAAADQGATAQQMVDFFGWKSHGMTNEYISTSEHQITNMAQKLAKTDTKEPDPKPKRKDKRQKQKRKREAPESSDTTDTTMTSESSDSSQEKKSKRKRKQHKKSDGKKVVIINM